MALQQSLLGVVLLYAAALLISAEKINERLSHTQENWIAFSPDNRKWAFCSVENNRKVYLLLREFVYIFFHQKNL